MRWTTGIGIALGGVGGAIAALMGAPKAPAPPPPAPRAAQAPKPEAVAAPAATPAAEPAAEPAAATSAPSPSAPASAAPSAAPAPAAAPAPLVVAAAPALDIPTTREALLRAEMLCDQKKDFDECARAAIALETGTTGPADPVEAKRFRRIALTHLVAQCEVDSPHACFVLAAKYRAGTELAAKPSSAEALEKRGAELCRLGRTAPECPSP
jgi:hypothetical protein